MGIYELTYGLSLFNSLRGNIFSKCNGTTINEVQGVPDVYLNKKDSWKSVHICRSNRIIDTQKRNTVQLRTSDCLFKCKMSVCKKIVIIHNVIGIYILVDLENTNVNPLHYLTLQIKENLLYTSRLVFIIYI